MEGTTLLLTLRSAAFMAALGLSTLALTACQVSTPTGTAAHPELTAPELRQATIPKADVEQATAQQVRDQYGGGPVAITCPGDLPIKIDASEKCVLTQDGKRFRITVRITRAASPDDASVDWQIGEQLAATG